jgi:F0F1-type ATP synthase membrane subunit a
MPVCTAYTGQSNYLCLSFILLLFIIIINDTLPPPPPPTTSSSSSSSSSSAYNSPLHLLVVLVLSYIYYIACASVTPPGDIYIPSGFPLDNPISTIEALVSPSQFVFPLATYSTGTIDIYRYR